MSCFCSDNYFICIYIFNATFMLSIVAYCVMNPMK